MKNRWWSIIFDLHKQDSENEYQFVWRIAQAKDAGILDVSWAELANILNKELKKEVPYGEAAYRKPYSSAKQFYEAGVFNSFKENYITELQEQKSEIRKEKQKLFDERSALRKRDRDDGRIEENIAILERAISENSKTTLPFIPQKYSNSNDYGDKSIIICLSDLHYGLNIDTYWGKYNSKIAEQRLNEYAEKILYYQNLFSVETATVLLLGDLVSGNIHLTTQLENRENLITQAKECSELISRFIGNLANNFKSIQVADVSGNHSRLGLKKDTVRDERIDSIIPWYVETSLKHFDNITFCPKKYDSTIADFEVCGNKYIGVHGDYDNFSETGVSKLSLMIGEIPNAVFYGHLHHCSFDDVSNVKLIRGGSLCGTGDDFTVSKRLNGKPSQMMCICDNTGIISYQPITLS